MKHHRINTAGLNCLRNIVFYLFFITQSSFGQTYLTTDYRENFDLALLDGTFEEIKDLTTQDALFLLEYQRTLRGHLHLQQYYSVLFEKQSIKSLKRDIDESIVLGDYIIEMGTFEKTFSRTSDEMLINHEGKFWFIWKNEEGKLRLFSYIEGYHKELPRNEYVVIDVGIEPQNNANIELMAYAALGEKAIREWNPELRIKLYMDDAVFYPFADTKKKGIDVLTPYLRAYHQHDIQIDLIQGKPFEYIYFEGYVLQFSAFEVDWRFNDASGTNKGKGVTLWKRQPDQSLKIYRKIGTHNDLNP